MNASLLEQTKCTHVLYAPEVENVVTPLLKERPETKIHKIASLEELILSEAKHYPFEKEYEKAKWDPILILHSSGSTGPPKPIVMNHATFAAGDNDRNLPRVPGRINQNWALWDFPKNETFFSAFPPFHLAGFSSMLVLPIYYSHATLVLAPPMLPPDGSILSDIMDQFPLKSIFCPPIIAEQFVGLFKDDSDALKEKCKNLNFILYAGGPLSQFTGSALSKVTDVCQFYGQTETGPIQALVPNRVDWASLEWHPVQEAIMEPSIDGTYEMVLKRNPALEKVRAVSCNFPDVEVWRTRDLFKPHPTKPNLWTFHGRADDIIVLSNGEKFNPVPSETHIASHPLVNGAMISGQGYPQASLIVEPKEHPSDPEAFIDKLWPIVEEANAQAPGHARITRGMILCSSPEKPFERTAKRTVIRSTTGKKYVEEIAELYNKDGPSHVKSVELTASPDLETTTKFIKDIISTAFPGHAVEEDDDLFVLGLDSLQTGEIISLLKSGINAGNPNLDVSWISVRFVYEHPTIKALVGATLAHLNPTLRLSNGGAPSMDRVEKMEYLIEKYTKDIPHHPHLKQTSTSEFHVILTGSTGTLGTQILVKLLSDPKVVGITCLDRSADAKDRIKRSFAQWKSPPTITDAVSFHQADYGKPDFGIPSAVAEELRSKVNLVIHNAWKVDFNHSLDSFEAVHVRGVRNLVDFAGSCISRPRLVFISSISTVLNWEQAATGAANGNGTYITTVPEVLPPSPAAAQALGYAESKAVAERILAAAAAEGGIDASVIRIGQIAGPIGDGNGGVWNAHEWFPLLLATSRALGKVPDGPSLGEIDWIPSDVVAATVWDIATSTPSSDDSPSPPLGVFHLVNPLRKPWSELLLGVQERLGGPGALKAVPMTDWVAELEQVDPRDKEAVAAKPASKVLHFFRDTAGGAYLGAEDIIYSTKESQKLSQALRDLGPIRDEWMARWMKDWGL